MKKILLTALFLPALCALVACDDKTTAPQAVSSDEKAEIIANRLEDWMGQWNGPEGTYVKLEKSGDGYAVIIKDLDKEERYLGVASETRIRFNRNNKEEYLTLVPGRMTGVKWMLDKPYCLMVRQGEAYCRDKI